MKNSKKSIKIYLIVLGLLVLVAIALQLFTSHRNETENTPSSSSGSAASTENTSVDENTEVTVSYKDTEEMNTKYGQYLSEQPIDFFSGEVKITLTSFYDSPVAVFSTDGANHWYYSLAVNESEFEEYIIGTEKFQHTVSDEEEQWVASSTEDGNAEYQKRFNDFISESSMDGVTELINEHPELRYQRTLTIGEELELDEFAVLLDDEAEAPSEDMTDEEYEAYIAKIEEEAEAMQEQLGTDTDSIFEIADNQVGYIYLYINSETETVQFAEVAYGDGSKAEIVFDASPELQQVPEGVEATNDLDSTEKILNSLLEKCTQ